MQAKYVVTLVPLFGTFTSSKEKRERFGEQMQINLQRF
jgi:hypothetical protein